MEEKKLTAKEIFLQLTILQKQLTENSQTSLHRLGDALSSLEGEDCEARFEQIPEICDVFKTRELTLLGMLEMYAKKYKEQYFTIHEVNYSTFALRRIFHLIKLRIYDNIMTERRRKHGKRAC